MKKAILFSIIFLSLVIMPVYAAAGISLETEHTDYYFTTGEEASVPVFTDNTYGYGVPGVISYTTTESIKSQGFSYSSSNTNSESFTVPKGSSSFSIGAESSDSQKTIEVSLSFKYTDSDNYVVSLPPFYIHFVPESEQNISQTSGSSQTSTESKAASSASSSQSSAQQIIQSMMSQAGSSSSDQSHMSSQQALQNNQMSQDSSALKKQLEEKSAETEKQRKSLAGIIENDTLYKSVNSSITSQGFSSSELSVLPSSDKTGAFSKYYYPD
ncbi:MAG: hypothetical protein PHR06_13195, partial [Candidatus Cloacimonetes bacterium]|nr:hypothetical protein [Candidatus Cloacimonadota bacterium]